MFDSKPLPSIAIFMASTFLFLITFVIENQVAAQNNSDQVTQQLEQLRREIKEFEKKISESQHRERDLLEELEDYDREVGLRLKLIQQLEQEKKRTQTALQSIQREITIIDVEIDHTYKDSTRVSVERDSLAALVSRRAVYCYKYFQRDFLRAILTSRTALQVLERQEYIKRIAEADRLNLVRLDKKNRELSRLGERLKDKKSEKSNRRDQLSQTLNYKQQLIAEENSEAELLKKRRADREVLLAQIRNDKNLLEKQLSEKKLAAQRVENLIRSLETEREKLPTVPEVTWAPDVPFRDLKGKMNWPAHGKVVTRFGLQKHEKLATVTENPGIEIAAEEDTPVAAVCTGRVTKITWMRGYGNTVIIDHQEGYYTVYAHLASILVREGQIIKAGDIVGRIGQSGTIEGPRLHFEIWAKREKQDPITWLKKL